MSCWYFEQSTFHKTPSIQDGIDYETECKYRKEGARFIMDLGTQMDLGCNTMATGVVFFHRFYMFQSFVEFPRFVTACCCIFLAGKVEETPKKCRDIIKIAQSLLSEEAFSSFGEDPKEEVMILEKILLQTIKFDLQVQHPYSFLIKYAKHLKGDKNKLHKMVQMAWTFINDSLCTTLCLQWEPEIIAIALMYLAGKLSKFKVDSWVNKKSYQTMWWDLFVEDLSMSTLEEICHQVLDLYSNVKDTIQESQQTVTQIVKNDPEIKSENPIKLEEVSSQQIVVKTEENNLHHNSIEAKEIHPIPNSIKLEPCTDSTLPVSCIKKEPELSQVENSVPKHHLYIAEWASVSASAIMSPGTSSVNSPLFLTPKFLVSPASIGSFNNHLNESSTCQNLNLNNSLPSNFHEQKNVSTTSFNNQNSNNFNDVMRYASQEYLFNKLGNNMPSDNSSINLSTKNLEFDSRDDNLPFRSREFGNYNDRDNVPFRSRGFGNCPDDDNASFRRREYADFNENLMNKDWNLKYDYLSKHYRGSDIFDYRNSRDLYNKVQYSTKMRNVKDRRSNFYDYPYPKSKTDFCTNLYSESKDFCINKMDKNSQRSRSKRSSSGGRSKNSRHFDRTKNN